jgi:hypothetical protein
METCSQPAIIVVCCLFENAVAVKAKLHFTVNTVWYNTAAVKGNSTNDVQGFTNFRVRVQS